MINLIYSLTFYYIYYYYLQVFLALVQLESEEFVVAYVEHIIEVAVRATLAVNTTPPGLPSPVLSAQSLAAELLEQLEQIVGSATFIGAYSTVQRRIQSSKAEKKRQLAAEAITAPHKYAARKVIIYYYYITLHYYCFSYYYYSCINIDCTFTNKKRNKKASNIASRCYSRLNKE